jgi:hypothetical protein
MQSEYRASFSELLEQGEEFSCTHTERHTDTHTYTHTHTSIPISISIYVYIYPSIHLSFYPSSYLCLYTYNQTCWNKATSSVGNSCTGALTSRRQKHNSQASTRAPNSSGTNTPHNNLAYHLSRVDMPSPLLHTSTPTPACPLSHSTHSQKDGTTGKH